MAAMHPEPGGGDGLAVDVILHVAAREHTGHARPRTHVGDDVAVGVELELTLEERGVRGVADGDEHAVDGDVLPFAGLVVASDIPVTSPLPIVRDVLDVASSTRT